MASNQVGDTQQGNHGRAEFRPSHGRDHGEGRDDAVEATEHLRHRAGVSACYKRLWLQEVLRGVDMGRMPWVLGVVGEIMCVWTLTMLLMYLLGVLLCFSGPQVAPSGIPSMISRVGKRSVALPSLMKEQLDDEPVVVIDDEEPSCAALEAATLFLA